ncbi:MAG: phosphoribosylaminoimidazolecarboxamide formyltransferase [Candidatus Mcinerneyibacterium aminivorans]|uniref:Phosphoribosylaminoimidazolecarboxamide formyltransferase n=1 Tax=Candidatus Mcinerneyibacterium aminivorans TaxID=2703815 RepID=A0A5D0MKN7_9BACT|nr:MAG: phosphoribosylaminoimidazolecarboxamide formyltransferase [Candidatus Mcinerneyibacterium aminivorans]
MEIKLKYGCNPHQKNAKIEFDDNYLNILNGKPGYINMLDALNSWQLVKKLHEATGKISAASFKHVSPAGAAVAKPLNENFLKSQFLKEKKYSKAAKAYIRARGGDRMSSYGDAAAISSKVDVSLAEYLRKEVSDLIIAPEYESKALEILKKKKNGNYLIIQIDPNYEPSKIEKRDIFGFNLYQDRDTKPITNKIFSKNNIVSKNKSVDNNIKETLITGNIALRYTQSNSVCVAYNGQIIGNGAGQQSRVHCTRLACEKAEKWLLQQHPKVARLNYVDGLSRAAKTNLVDKYLLWDKLSSAEREFLLDNLKEKPELITQKEKQKWLKNFDNLTLCSDAFFPFRDSIDRANKLNVKYISQPGGSIRDENVTNVVDKYNMIMYHTGIRLFRH